MGFLVSETSFSVEQVKILKKSKPKSFAIETQVGVGVGQFQDIRVPLNELNGRRADGTTKEKEDKNQIHSGFPLVLGLGMENYASILHFNTNINVTHISVNRQVDNVTTSSYTRLDASQEAGFVIFNSNVESKLLGGMGMRRSAFNNISTGHSIDSTYMKGRLTLDFHRAYGFEIYGLQSINATFKYNKGKFFEQEEIANSSASMQEFKAYFSRNMNRKVKFLIGASQEKINATIDDIDSYKDFGLAVYTFEKQSREYNLSTNVYRIGFEKKF